MNYYLTVLKKYAQFGGRAQRAEYWYFFLFNILISIVVSVIDKVIGTGFLGTIYALALFIPGLAVGVRRLHDTNRSGWWILISLIPLIGIIWLIVLLAMDSDSGENQYGPNPKGVAVN